MFLVDSLYMLKPGRLVSAPVGDSAIGKVHFLTSYVWRVWENSLHFFLAYVCSPIY